jgi:predicted extracellular nuclease
MFFTRRRAILIGVVAVIAAGIVLTPLILTLTLPPDINAVKVNLDNVEVATPSPEEETSNLLTLNIFFKVDNPTDKTLTTSKIDYTLFANGESLGNGQVDYVDIPVNGRPQLMSGGEATISSKFEIPRNDPRLAQINSGNLSSSDINWEAEGTADIESGFITTPLAFKAEFQRSS